MLKIHIKMFTDYSSLNPIKNIFKNQMDIQKAFENQLFVNTYLLKRQRIERQTNKHVLWNLQQLEDIYFQNTKIQIKQVFTSQIYKKMFSFNYQKVEQAIFEITKCIQSLKYDDQIREVYDLLLKWIFIKLWGGQPRMLSIIDLVPQIISVLYRKKVEFVEFQVQLVTAIIRQYLVSLGNSQFFSKTIYTITKGLIAVSSVEEVLKKILKQLQLDISSIHKHYNNNEAFIQFYKHVFGKVITQQLIKNQHQASSQNLQSKYCRKDNSVKQFQLLQSKLKFEEQLSTSIQALRSFYNVQHLNISIYIAPEPHTTLSLQLQMLFPPRNNVVNFFNVFIQQDSPDVIQKIVIYAKCIFGSILKSVYSIIAARRQYHLDLVIDQINLLQNCIKRDVLIRHIEQLLAYTMSFVLSQLLYEDQNKFKILQQLRSRNIECNNDIFINALNGVMLRLLQNGHPQQIISILLELWAVQSTIKPVPKKTITLIIICLGRVSSEFGSNKFFQSVKLFFIRSIEFLLSIQYDTQFSELNITSKYHNKEYIKDEDHIANQIKKIVRSIYKNINSDIFHIYTKAINKSNLHDKYMINFINDLHNGQQRELLYSFSKDTKKKQTAKMQEAKKIGNQ